MRVTVLDIGGTSIKSGVFDAGSLLEVKETETNAGKGGPYVVKRAMEILRSYGKTEGIGISTAGQVDFQKGAIRYANSNIPGYTGMEIRKLMEKEFHVPVMVENDVNAAAIGEAHYGAGREYDDFLCLTYGTGVGGAIVLGKDVYRGSSFSAGEMGAMLLHPEKRNAYADMYSGCYEKYASVTALVGRAMLVDRELNNGRRIFQEIHRPQVREVVDLWIGEIVCGLISLIHIFNPPCIILGGGIMQQEYILEQVRERVYDQIMESYRQVEILTAALHNRAGMFGAAHLIEKRLAGESKILQKG